MRVCKRDCEGGVGSVILEEVMVGVVVAEGVKGVIRSCLRGREGEGVVNKREEEVVERRTAGEAREGSGEGATGRIMSKNCGLISEVSRVFRIIIK